MFRKYFCDIIVMKKKNETTETSVTPETILLDSLVVLVLVLIILVLTLVSFCCFGF